MIDAHVHIGRENGHESSQEQIQGLLEGYVNQGVRAVRDGGDVLRLGLVARELAPELGLIYKTPVYALVKAGGYGGFLGQQCSGLADIRAALGELMALKPDFVKVILSGIVSFDRYGVISPGGFEPEELRYIVGYAHDAGLPVMAHCNGATAVAHAVELGVDSVEHGYFIGISELEAMAELGTLWIPTFVPLVNYLVSGTAGSLSREVLAQILKGHAENLRTALTLGVPVAVGSDAGAAFVPHGQGVHDEVECFVRAGIPREDVLRLAEENGARALKL
ncbi:MAG: amidohydrolase family protein [Treponema sp.]|jgi:imidazolonepropionase-like amidohydrolase|nr:amidohydrolase family protein [Treponema sp.]